MIITIAKNGEPTQRVVKSYNNLYSICNYRNNSNFDLLYTWDNTYYLYGKKIGRAGYENNYIFRELSEKYYGTLCIIKKINEEYEPLTIDEWNTFYNMHIVNETTETNNNSIINDKELTKEEYEEE
jgi:hypothetical protein